MVLRLAWSAATCSPDLGKNFFYVGARDTDTYSYISLPEALGTKGKKVTILAGGSTTALKYTSDTESEYSGRGKLRFSEEGGEEGGTANPNEYNRYEMTLGEAYLNDNMVFAASQNRVFGNFSDVGVAELMRIRIHPTVEAGNQRITGARLAGTHKRAAAVLT